MKIYNGDPTVHSGDRTAEFHPQFPQIKEFQMRKLAAHVRREQLKAVNKMLLSQWPCWVSSAAGVLLGYLGRMAWDYWRVWEWLATAL